MDDNMNFGGGGFWIFALLILVFGMNGFGGWGANGNNRLSTIDDISFNRLENQVRANENYIQQGFTNIGNGLCDGFYTTAQQINAIDKSVLESRYLNAQAIAEATASTNARIDAISQKMDAQRIHELEAKVQTLELANATASVVRYPTQMSYASPCNPFCGCGGCGTTSL